MKPSRKSYMKVGVKKLLRTGLVPARACGAQAVGIAPTRLKLRRQMAAAAVKKESTSLSLFLEVYGLEVEEALFPMATQAQMACRAKAAWRKQIFEVQAWRQVRGPTGAGKCGTRDLGIK